MKIALVEIWPKGGTARYAAELARALTATKSDADEVHLIAPATFEDLDGGGQETHKVLTPLGGGSRGRIGRGATFVRARHRQAQDLRATLDALAPDVVHHLGTSAVTPRRKWPTGAKTVVTVHDLPQPGGGVTQVLFRYWSRHFPTADRILVHGPRTRTELLHRYGEGLERRIRTVSFIAYDYGAPSAAEPALRRRYDLPEGHSVVLLFGSIRRNKGLDDLIRTLSTPEMRDVHLLVAGRRAARTEPPVEDYEQLAVSYGVDDRITWITRWIPDEEVPDIFAVADVAALPYKKSFAAQSSVLTVAATHGVPVVATDVGELAPAVEEAGLGIIAPSEAPAQLAAAIRRVLQQPRPAEGPKRTPARAAAAGTADQHWEIYRELAPDR